MWPAFGAAPPVGDTVTADKVAETRIDKGAPSSPARCVSGILFGIVAEHHMHAA